MKSQKKMVLECLNQVSHQLTQTNNRVQKIAGYISMNVPASQADYAACKRAYAESLRNTQTAGRKGRENLHCSTEPLGGSNEQG